MNPAVHKLVRSVRRLIEPPLPAVINEVQRNKLTYLPEDALKDLYRRVQAIEKEALPGILVEAGCALGGSAIVMASAKSPSRPLYVYDVFATIPPPSDEDGEDVIMRYAVIKEGKASGIEGDPYYGYEENLYEKVKRHFQWHRVPVEENNIRMVKGLFEDTLQVAEPVALAHIDGDWYNSVMTCLERIAPHLVPRGVLVIDDYDAWSGCRKAVDEYFVDKKDQYEFVFKSRLHIVRR